MSSVTGHTSPHWWLTIQLLMHAQVIYGLNFVFHTSYGYRAMSF